MFTDANAIADDSETALLVGARAGYQLEKKQHNTPKAWWSVVSKSPKYFLRMFKVWWPVLISTKEHSHQAKTDCDLSRCTQTYLSLTLSFKVNHTHVYNGTQVCECLHHLNIGATLVWFHIQLQGAQPRPWNNTHTHTPYGHCFFLIVWFTNFCLPGSWGWRVQ